jgi:hypothetical protein
MFGDVYSNRDPSPGGDASPLMARLLMPASLTDSEGDVDLDVEAGTGAEEEENSEEGEEVSRGGLTTAPATSSAIGADDGGAGGGASARGSAGWPFRGTGNGTPALLRADGGRSSGDSGPSLPASARGGGVCEIKPYFMYEYTDPYT